MIGQIQTCTTVISKDLLVLWPMGHFKTLVGILIKSRVVFKSIRYFFPYSAICESLHSFFSIWSKWLLFEWAFCHASVTQFRKILYVRLWKMTPIQDSVRLLWYAYWTRMLRPFYFARILAFSPLLGPARGLEFNQNFLPAHKS